MRSYEWEALGHMVRFAYFAKDILPMTYVEDRRAPGVEREFDQANAPWASAV